MKWAKVMNEKIPRHPELVSGSVGGTESKEKDSEINSE